MPRLTPERREARRAEIVAAARRCFARDGFRQTSMLEIAAEAGLSAGAPYRYFAGKEEMIVEIVGETFVTRTGELMRLLDQGPPPTVADIAAAMIDLVGTEGVDAAGRPIPVDEFQRCAVEAWGELLRNDDRRQQVMAGFDRARQGIVAALRRGQRAGTIPADLDPDRGTRVVIALLQGFIVQRTVFGLTDTDGFVQDLRTLLTGAAEAGDS